MSTGTRAWVGGWTGFSTRSTYVLFAVESANAGLPAVVVARDAAVLGLAPGKCRAAPPQMGDDNLLRNDNSHVIFCLIDGVVLTSMSCNLLH